MTTTRSETRTASGMLCVTTTIVVPVRSQSRRSSRSKRSRVSASRALNGSSRTMGYTDCIHEPMRQAIAAGVRTGADFGQPGVADAPDPRIDVVVDGKVVHAGGVPRAEAIASWLAG